MKALALKLESPGGSARGKVALYAAETSTAATPTAPPAQLTSEQLTVVVASFSSLVFFVIIVVLLSVIYRKDRHCCRLGSYQGPHTDTDAPPQYYSSRQTLVASPRPERSRAEDSGAQADGPFFIGLPSGCRLPAPDGALPRLPSYESVRKKDRQRQIHMMIADRFGLNGAIVAEPPPSYEESMRQSVELPYDFLPSSQLQVPTSEPVAAAPDRSRFVPPV